MKTPWIITAIAVIGCGITSYGYYAKNQDNQKLAIGNIIYVAENRLLKEEVNTLERKPSYEEGCRDTILKMGGPQTPGAYMDGWNAAILTLDTRNYADGYHAAIQQFGYVKTNGNRWIVDPPLAEPKSEKSEPKGQPVKYPPKEEK